MTNESQSSIATQGSFHASQESDIISPSVFNDISRECGDLEGDFLTDFQPFGENDDSPVNNQEDDKMYHQYPLEYSNYHATNQALMQNMHQLNMNVAMGQTTPFEQQNYNVEQPPLQPNFTQTRMLPIKQEYTGDRQFKMTLSNPSQAKNWVYSDKLQKVFINMNQSLPINFEWMPTLNDIYIRAALVFELDEYSNDVVKMCPNHLQPGEMLYKGHVLICEGPNSIHQAGTDGHHSICTDVSGVNISNTKLLYKFRCKNSCSNGMNRRATKIKFTLESNLGEILGCQTLLVRICSCPKRDKDKEESEKDVARSDVPRGKKRKSNTSAPIPPEGKKLMEYSNTKKGIQLVVNLPDHDDSEGALICLHDYLSGKANRTKNFERYNPYIKILNKRLGLE